MYQIKSISLHTSPVVTHRWFSSLTTEMPSSDFHYRDAKADTNRCIIMQHRSESDESIVQYIKKN